MKAFFDSVRMSLFGGRLMQGQIDGLSRIVAACEREKLSLPETAYVLATAYHETARTMLPVRESQQPGEAPIDDETAYRRVSAYCAKNGRDNYARRDPGTGQSYYGRGYVQLTHRSNYERMGRMLDMDLERQPDLAMHPETAALILIRGMKLGTFTGKKLADYFYWDVADYREARRIVNGTDRAETLAGYALQFQTALAALGGRSEPLPAAGASTRPESRDAAGRGVSGGLVAFLLAAAAAAVAFLTKRNGVW